MNINIEELKELLGDDVKRIDTIYTINIHDNLLEALVIEVMRDNMMFCDKFYYSFCLNGKLFKGGFTMDDMEKQDDGVQKFFTNEVSKYISQALLRNLGTKVPDDYIRSVRQSPPIRPKEPIKEPEEHTQIAVDYSIST